MNEWINWSNEILKFTFVGNKLLLILLCLFFFAGSFIFLNNFISNLLAQKIRKNLEKNNIYECGFLSKHSINFFINYKFIIIGLLFILFDLEIILLFTWALNFSITFFSFQILVGFLKKNGKCQFLFK